jgi:Holliday junction resolvase RusA-like endonuclease
MLTIPSAPRTKKNSTDVITTKRGRKVQLQSKAYYQFADDVRAVVLPRRKILRAPLPGRLHINAQFYCDNATADQKNLEQGLADALEKAKLVENDRQFASWDGSRTHVDKARPRVEITIRPLV